MLINFIRYSFVRAMTGYGVDVRYSIFGMCSDIYVELSLVTTLLIFFRISPEVGVV
jgi:hypothetical protein